MIRVPLVEVDIGLLADQVGVAATDTLDLGQGVHDLLLAINLERKTMLIFKLSCECVDMPDFAHVGVEQTQDELEVRLFPGDERHRGGIWIVDVTVVVLRGRKSFRSRICGCGSHG